MLRRTATKRLSEYRESFCATAGCLLSHARMDRKVFWLAIAVVGCSSGAGNDGDGLTAGAAGEGAAMQVRGWEAFREGERGVVPMPVSPRRGEGGFGGFVTGTGGGAVGGSFGSAGSAGMAGSAGDGMAGAAGAAGMSGSAGMGGDPGTGGSSGGGAVSGAGGTSTGGASSGGSGGTSTGGTSGGGSGGSSTGGASSGGSGGGSTGGASGTGGASSGGSGGMSTGGTGGSTGGSGGTSTGGASGTGGTSTGGASGTGGASTGGAGGSGGASTGGASGSGGSSTGGAGGSGGVSTGGAAGTGGASTGGTGGTSSGGSGGMSSGGAAGMAGSAGSGGGDTLPPHWQDGLGPGVNYGIAQGYPGDAGLDAHPHVFAVENFETGTVTIHTEYNRYSDNTTVTSAEAYTGQYAGEHSWPENYGGPTTRHPLPLDADNGDERPSYFQRMCFKFDDSFHPGTPIRAVGVKGFGIYAERNNPSTSPPTVGTDWYNSAVQFVGWGPSVKPQANDGFLWVGHQYAYNPDPENAIAEVGSVVVTAPPAGQSPRRFSGYPTPFQYITFGDWNCYEVGLYLNRPGMADGEARFWIDGVLLVRITGVMYRSVADLMPNNMQMNLHRTTDTFPHTMVRWTDNIVLARRYIGPVD